MIHCISCVFSLSPVVGKSAGILELGGASTQIAFIPDGSILADKFPVRLAGRVYPLYVHSYLYYGQNFADLWVKEYLHRKNRNLTELTNPCMLRGALFGDGSGRGLWSYNWVY